MFNKSIISTAIISLASLSSIVNAQDTVGLEAASPESGALAELRLSNRGVDEVSEKVTQVMNTPGNVQIYTSGRNWVTVTDNEDHSGSAKHYITKNHR